jgi:hypothetical protein
MIPCSIERRAQRRRAYGGTWLLSSTDPWRIHGLAQQQRTRADIVSRLHGDTEIAHPPL